MNQECMRDAAHKWATENYQPRDGLTQSELDIAISAAAEGYFACLMEQAGKGDQVSNKSSVQRRSLTAISEENGITNQWYFDCDGHYIDVARCQNGLYSILFVDRFTKVHTWFDQDDAIANAVAKCEIPLVADAAYLIQDALQFAREYAEKKNDNIDLIQACDRAIFILNSAATTIKNDPSSSDSLECVRAAARTKAFQDMFALFSGQWRHIASLMDRSWQIVSVELNTVPGLVDAGTEPFRYSISSSTLNA